MADVNIKSTYGTYLRVKSGSDYKTLCPIQDFSDLWSEPGTIQVTTMSDPEHNYIKALAGQERITFTTNLYFGEESEEGTYLYIKKQYDVAGKTFDFAIDFCDMSGEAETILLRAAWSGQLSIGINGAGVDEAHTVTISITKSTPIVESKPAA